MHLPSTAWRASALALVLLAVGLIGAPGASAAAFRYWTYWHAPSGTWVFATDGPATAVPADGSVEGWRFAVTTQSGTAADSPSVAPSFETLCGATAPAAGSKRVGLVIDPGPSAIAPAGQTPPPTVATCMVVPENATGYEVMSKVAAVRTDGGLICSLAAYPAGECAAVLEDDEAQAIAQALAQSPTAAPAPVATSTAAPVPDQSSPVATIAVASLLIVGAAAWGVLHRRQTRAGRDG
jgi:hypothetical protein